jgi:UDP-N-acetylglucosamine 1-carboxyvinyltransferase
MYFIMRCNMEQYVVKGGIPLEGEVTIAGAKNAALGILAAAVMTDQEVIIENVPNVRDTRVLLQAIQGIGAKVRYVDEHTVSICGATINSHDDLCVDDEYIRKIRASYYLLGALLGKYKHSQVSLPGGCDIGARPIDLHIKGFEALGATVDIVNGMISTHADELIGNHIYMDVTSVGATINVMMAAVLAEGKTTIENAAKEPHIVDVANFLNSMGANIKGAGTDVIRIRGVKELHGTTYSIIPDQIEAGTFMVAAAATKGNILIKNVIPKHLEAISSKLNEIGAHVIEYDDSVRVMADKRLKSTNIKTLPYPGFPTDMQPQMAITLALSNGTSIVTESIFENRFKYVAELSRMGAHIRVEGNTAIIDGVETFSGANVAAPDLRAGAALVIAALVADDFSVITDIKYIQRGYEKFEEKLRGLGARIEKVDTEKDIQKFKLKIS